MSNDQNNNFLKRLEALMQDPNSRDLTQKVASDSFLATKDATKIVNLINAMNSNEKAQYQELNICCRNMIKNANVMSQAFNYYIRSAHFQAIYNDANAARTMQKQAENFKYLHAIDWSGYLKLSQSNHQLTQAIQNLKKTVDTWNRGIGTLRQSISKK